MKDLTRSALSREHDRLLGTENFNFKKKKSIVGHVISVSTSLLVVYVLQELSIVL